MAVQSCKPAAHLCRRCRLVAGLLFIFMLLLTVGLWRASLTFLDIRFREASKQSARQTIERLTTFLSSRLLLLRHVSHFYASSEGIQESEFQAFCASVMGDVPGLMAIVVTDRDGTPSWIASPGSLSRAAVYVMTADPKLAQAMSRSLATMQPALTDTIEVPEQGSGFLATIPILVGHRHLGYIVGVFQYQNLLNYLLQPDLLSHYHVTIHHAGWPVFPQLAVPYYQAPATSRASGVTPYKFSETVTLGGQDWVISVQPLGISGPSPTNFVSLTILGLGLILSGLLAWLAYRWQWQAMRFQAEARDSQTRLERTGLSLVELKSELDLILNSVDEGIVFFDENLEPVQANAAYLMAFGLTEHGRAMQSGTAHHEHMIGLANSETKYWTLFNALRDAPEQTYTDELEFPPAKGEKGPMRVFLRRATVACNSEGEPRGLLVIYKDMTRIKAMDRVKDEFLSNVTHELRSPLASIKGFAQTIKRDPQMPAETRQEFIAIICDEASRLHDLIEELLDLRRMEAQGTPFNPTQYDFRALVEEVVRGTRTILLSKNLTVKVQWNGLFGSTLNGDVAQISRAVRNLLVNAVKYSPAEGEISLFGHFGQQRVWLEISDQGTGISEKDLPHIFDKFYRGTHQGKQKGTGLGLSIVKHIVELHGGHLGVRSDLGSGTTFRIELPRNYTQPPQAMNKVSATATLASLDKEDTTAVQESEAAQEAGNA